MTASPSHRTVRRSALALLAALALASQAAAQAPRIELTSVYPPGGKAGTSVDVKIAGASLEKAHKLHFSHDGIKAEPKMGQPTPFNPKPAPVPNAFKVTIAGNVPPGIYEVRAAGRFGISNARAFVVGDRDEALQDAANNAIDKAQPLALDTVVTGTADSGKFDYYKLSLKKGQRVILDVWAHRIDSQMIPALVMIDPGGTEVARDRNTNQFDPLLDFTAPADGDYVLKLYDFLYGGSANHFYRLTASTGPYVDFVFPPAGQAGKKSEFTVYGRLLPGGSPSDVTDHKGIKLEKITVQIDIPADPAQANKPVGFVEPRQSFVDTIAYRVKGPKGVSNPVSIGVARVPIVAEAEPNNESAKATKVTPPCEVVGQFNPRRDLDWIAFDAKKGQVYQIEVLGHRLGLPVDPYLIIQQVTKNDKGEEQVKELTALDDGSSASARKRSTTTPYDTGSDDPQYRFTAPVDGTYRVQVRDLYGQAQGQGRYVYRLAIREAQPDFRLILLPPTNTAQRNQAKTLPPGLWQGGTQLVDVRVVRQDGFTGPVEVSAEGLPAGVKASPLTIASWAGSGKLVLQADEGAADWAGQFNVVGKAKVGGKDVTRHARTGEVIWPASNNQSPAISRVTRNAGLAVIANEKQPFVVQLNEGKPMAISRAGKLTVPVKVVRRDGFKEKIDLKAVTIHQQIKCNNASINGDKSDGKLELTLNTQSPTGAFTFYVNAETTYDYERAPDLAKAAAERKKAIDEKVKSLTEASKQAADAVKKLPKDATKEAKDAASKKAADAAAMLKKAQDAAKTAAADAKKYTDAAKKKKTKFTFPSTPVTVTVTAGPIEIKPGSASVKGKQGEKIELPINIQRLYDYKDEVTLELVAPKGVTGVSGKGKIEKEKADAKITVTLAANATIGTHKFQVRGRSKYNGQNVDVTQPVEVVIEKAPEKEKK